MSLPSWSREFFSGSIEEVTARLRRSEPLRDLQTRATHLLGDLPVTAARSLDRVMQETRRGAEQVRRWSRRQTSLSTSAINGSGVLFHPSLRGVPLPIDQIETLAPAPDLFQVASGPAADRITGRLRSALSKHTDAQIAVAASMASAATAIGACAASAGWIPAVPRSSAMRLEAGRPLPEQIAAGGCRVIEIGAPERCDSSDWDQAAGSAGERLMRVTVKWPAALQHECEGGGFDARDNMPGRQVQFLPLGSFGDFPGLGSDRTSRVGKGAAEDQTIVVLPGNRLVGGPQCGLILASSEMIAAITSTMLWSVLEANLETKATLALALEHTESSAGEPAPASAMLQTSVENLQNRGARLATQLVGSGAVAACQVTELPASLVPGDAGMVPSRQLRIVRHGGGAADWTRSLAAESPALLARVDEDSLVVDLRWIPPSLDSELVRLLSSSEEA